MDLFAETPLEAVDTFVEAHEGMFYAALLFGPFESEGEADAFADKAIDALHRTPVLLDE